jgi:hypothetical protein
MPLPVFTMQPFVETYVVAMFWHLYPLAFGWKVPPFQNSVLALEYRAPERRIDCATIVPPLKFNVLAV